MPTVKGGPQTPQGGYQTDAQIDRTHRPTMARDELRDAYAGDENEGPAAHHKEDSAHSTNLKGRKTEKSKTRTPIR